MPTRIRSPRAVGWPYRAVAAARSRARAAAACASRLRVLGDAARRRRRRPPGSRRHLLRAVRCRSAGGADLGVDAQPARPSVVNQSVDRQQRRPGAQRRAAPGRPASAAVAPKNVDRRCRARTGRGRRAGRPARRLAQPVARARRQRPAPPPVSGRTSMPSDSRYATNRSYRDSGLSRSATVVNGQPCVERARRRRRPSCRMCGSARTTPRPAGQRLGQDVVRRSHVGCVARTCSRVQRRQPERLQPVPRVRAHGPRGPARRSSALGACRADHPAQVARAAAARRRRCRRPRRSATAAEQRPRRPARGMRPHRRPAGGEGEVARRAPGPARVTAAVAPARRPAGGPSTSRCTTVITVAHREQPQRRPPARTARRRPAQPGRRPATMTSRSARSAMPDVAASCPRPSARAFDVGRRPRRRPGRRRRRPAAARLVAGPANHQSERAEDGARRRSGRAVESRNAPEAARAARAAGPSCRRGCRRTTNAR